MFYVVFDILTIGLPFCAFKLTAGDYFQLNWLIILGVIDLFINLTNLISIGLKKTKVFDTCFLSWLSHKLIKSKQDKVHSWQELGESIDVLLSFSIVAYVIGFGHITSFSQTSVFYWNIAVVLNVLGAGSVRLLESIKKVRN